MPETKELTVGQLAERSGVSVSALHFYEREGLIGSRRTSGNQRRYGRDTLRTVALIRVAQRVGIPLQEIRGVLDTLPDRRLTRRDWERVSKRWQADLDERIEGLQQLRDRFNLCIGCGCLSLDVCAMVNPDDVVAARGPGPRYLIDGELARTGAQPAPACDR